MFYNHAKAPAEDYRVQIQQSAFFFASMPRWSEAAGAGKPNSRTNLAQSFCHSVDSENGLIKEKARHVAEDYFDVVKFNPQVSWQEQQEAGWQQAVKLWHGIMWRCDLRCQVLNDFSVLLGPVECCEMLSDISRGRPFVTLKKLTTCCISFSSFMSNCLIEDLLRLVDR